MTITFLESGGDATGGKEFYNGSSSGTTAIDSTQARTGLRSVKCDSAASASAYVGRLACLADAGRRISVGYYLENLPTSTGNGTGIMRALVGTTECFSVNVTSAGLIRLTTTTTNLGTGATVLATGQWYRVAVSYVITSTTNFTIKVWLDGVLQVTATQANGTLANAATANLRCGWTGTAAGASKILYFDDVYVDDLTSLDDPGDINITNKKPSAAGDVNDFDTAVGSGTNRWDRVSEVPLSTANRYTQAGSSQVQENYTVQASTVGDENIDAGATILGNAAWVYWTSVSVSGTPGIMHSGSVVALTLTTGNTYQLNLDLATTATYPSTNQAVGLRSTGTTVDTMLAECGVLVAYIPSAVPPPSHVVKLGHWRWYSDAADASLVALAAEDTIPTLSGAQMQDVILRLRAQLVETGGSTGTAAVQLEYGEDGTNYQIIDNQSITLNLEGVWFRWADGADTVGSTIASALLTGSTASGLHHEAASATETVGASSVREIDIAIHVHWPAPDATVTFRIQYNTAAIALNTGATAIKLQTSTAADRPNTVAYLDGRTNTLYSYQLWQSSWPRLYYADSAWWLFIVQFNTPTILRAYRWTGSGGWVVSSLTMPTSAVDKRDGYAFKTIGGVPLVFCFWNSSSGNMRYVRGTFTGGAITWGSIVDYGVATYGVTTHTAYDDGGSIWIGGHDSTTGVWAARSTNADAGTAWTSGFQTRKTLTVSGISTTDNAFTIVGLGSDKALCVYKASTGLRWATVTDAGGFGTDTSLADPAHPNDWGICRSGNYVYCAYINTEDTSGTARMKVYDIGAGTWSSAIDTAGGDVSVDPTGGDDGLPLIASGDDIYMFWTKRGTTGLDRIIQYKKYTGPGASGTWQGAPTTLTTGGRVNGDAITASMGDSGNGQIIVAWEVCDDTMYGTGEAVEYYTVNVTAYQPTARRGGLTGRVVELGRRNVGVF